jgi:uncharacterized protein YutE (UPF0331/DUF86 family)
MSDSNAARILEAWVQLEEGLRKALPVCAVQPPTQPLELLSALRINGQVGAEEEETVLALREIRNRVAHDPNEPDDDEADAFQEAVTELLASLQPGGGSTPAC